MEPALDLSSLIKPIRMMLCTDEDNLAILVLALLHMNMQSKEDPLVFNYIIYCTATCRNSMEMNIRIQFIQFRRMNIHI